MIWCGDNRRSWWRTGRWRKRLRRFRGWWPPGSLHGFSLREVEVSYSSQMDYIAYVHKDPTSDYGVSFPDFPGCVTAGKTLEEARRMVQEALCLHIAGMIEDGDKLPAPSTLDHLA